MTIVVRLFVCHVIEPRKKVTGCHCRSLRVLNGESCPTLKGMPRDAETFAAEVTHSLKKKTWNKTTFSSESKVLPQKSCLE
jgi:hypothetical protein